MDSGISALISKQIHIYYHRIRAMSAREMAYRLGRNLSARLSQYNLIKKRALKKGAAAAFGLPANALWSALANRNFFSWQNMPAAQVCSYYDAHWPNYRLELLKAADRLCAHQFQIFDRAVDFSQKIDWHYDIIANKSLPRVHWTRLPYWRPGTAPGVKYIWELNRHQHFVTLAQAYFISGNDTYSDELIAQWLDWLEANPPDTGINWSSALEMGLRIVSWTWALHLSRRARAWKAEVYSRVLQSIHEQSRHIYRHLSLFSSANNHLLGELLGLIYAGCYFSELPDAAKYRQKGFELFFQELERQVYPDGVIKEQSSGYQRYLLEMGLLAKFAADLNGIQVPAVIMQRMEKMAEFVSAIMDEAGQVPALGDCDDGQVLLLDALSEKPYADILASAALLFNRMDFKAQSAGWKPAGFWLFGADAEGTFNRMASQRDERTLSTFPQGGYAVIRSGQHARQQLALFDAGPLGLDEMAAHGHADALSFILSVGAQPVLIDSGTYTYRGAREWRNYFRGTASHNTITIDSHDQSEIAGPFQWARHARAVLHSAEDRGASILLHGSHKGYLEVEHHRQVEFDLATGWTITDDLTGKGRHNVQLLWHFAPCDLVQISTDSFCASFPLFEVHVRVQASRRHESQLIMGRKKPLQGWHSPHFAVKKPNPVLCVNIKNIVPVQIRTDISIKF